MKANTDDELRERQDREFSGSIEGWTDFINDTEILDSPTLLLFAGGNVDLTTTIGNLMTLMGVQLENGTLPEVCCLIPRSAQSRQIPMVVSALIDSELTKRNWPTQEKARILDRVQFGQMQTNTVQEIQRYTSNLPASSVVVICTGQYLNSEDAGSFNDSDAAMSIKIDNPFGNLAILTPRQDQIRHTTLLAESLLDIVTQREHFVFVFIEHPGIPNYDGVPQSLLENPALILAGVPDSTGMTQLFDTIPELIEQSKSVGIEEAIDLIRKEVNIPELWLALSVNILRVRGFLPRAVVLIREHLDFIANMNSEAIIEFSRAALDGNDLVTSQQLLEQVRPENLHIFNHLNAARLIAKRLNLDEYMQNCITRMEHLYPSCVPVQTAKYTEAVRNRDFHTAVDLATTLGFQYQAQFHRVQMEIESDLAQASQASDMNGHDAGQSLIKSILHRSLEKFISDAVGIRKQDRARSDAAFEAAHYQAYRLAQEWSRQVDQNSEAIEDAIALRIGLFRREMSVATLFQKDINDLIDELQAIMRFIAHHPENLRLRGLLEEVLEDHLGQTECVLLLASILGPILTKRLMENEIIQSPKKPTILQQVASVEVSDEEITRYEKFLKEYMTVLKGQPLIVFISPDLTELNPSKTDELLRISITYLNYYNPREVEPKDIYLHSMLHLIGFLSQELDDPDTDLTAVRLGIGLLAQAGHQQDARDLAEHTIQNLPELQPSNLEWRIGHAWACYAEAFQRSGNAMAGLRCLCFAFLSWDGAATDIETLAKDYRLTCRIFRDLGLLDIALQSLDMERHLREKHGLLSKSIEMQLQQLSIVIRLRGDRDIPTEELFSLFHECSSLIEESLETGPLLGCQASILWEIRKRRVKVDSPTVSQYEKRLEKLPLAIANYYRKAIETDITVHDIDAVLRLVGQTRSLSDLGFQTKMIEILLRESITFACSTGDAELFVKACAYLAQPILTKRNSSLPQSKRPPNPEYAAWASKIAKGTLSDPQAINEAFSGLIVEPESFHQLADLQAPSIAELQHVLMDGEILILLVHDINHQLGRLVVQKESVSNPEILTGEIWSREAYREWLSSDLYVFGWEPGVDPWDDDKPTPAQVRELTKELSIGELPSAYAITIIPDAILFGFPFALSPSDDSLLGEKSRVTCAPSPTWLVQARTTVRRHFSGLRSWMGSNDASDIALNILWQGVSSTLTMYGFDEVLDFAPDGMVGAKIAVIGSHGGIGVNDQFKVVTDRIQYFTPHMIASGLADSACVVLFVCYAGRSTQQLLSTETLGLVADLLRNGVQTVVAAPWPLFTNLPAKWFPAFMERYVDGGTVSESAYAGAQAVREWSDNPGAWGALHVFGDGALRLNVEGKTDETMEPNHLSE